MSSRLRHRHLDDHQGGAISERDVEGQSKNREERKEHGLQLHRVALLRLSWQFEKLYQADKSVLVASGLLLAVVLLVILYLLGGSGATTTSNSNNIYNTNSRASLEILRLHPAPKDAKVSVIIMNHNRPRMLKESNLIPTLSKHHNIGEILLCHSNPKTRFDLDHNPKVRSVDAVEANQKWGLSLRFHLAATEATYPWVMHVDDDQELSLQAISDVLAEFARDSRRIVGRYGRSYQNNFWNRARHGYNTRTILGPVEVVLTKFMVMEQRVCQYFAKYAYLVEETMLAESKPLWNGEDIFMNLVANHVYGVPLDGPYHNYAFEMDVWEASDVFKDDDSGAHDVSGNMDRHRPWTVGWTAWREAYAKAQAHTAYRGRLWDMVKHKLAQLPRPDDMLD